MRAQGTGRPSSGLDSEPAIAPPPRKIRASSDIVRLRARLHELAEADASLGDFTRAVDALAAGFRMEAISEFLMRIRKKDD